MKAHDIYIYINTNNTWYENNHDMNIYSYLYDTDINTFKVKVYLILENMWIMKLLFKDNIISTHDKLYQTSKRKTSHITIVNDKTNMKAVSLK